MTGECFGVPVLALVPPVEPLLALAPPVDPVGSGVVPGFFGGMITVDIDAMVNSSCFASRGLTSVNQDLLI